MESLELAILNWIQVHLRCGFLDAVLPAISRTADHGELWILLAVVLLLIKNQRKHGAAMAVGLVLALVSCNMILKPLIGRIRPFAVNGLVELLIPPPLDASFPSGHTAASFAAASRVPRFVSTVSASSTLGLHVHVAVASIVHSSECSGSSATAVTAKAVNTIASVKTSASIRFLVFAIFSIFLSF